MNAPISFTKRWILIALSGFAAFFQLLCSPHHVKKQQASETMLKGCPLAAQRNVGLFRPESTSQLTNDFQNVILLVSCNHAYYDMLENWEFLANQLGLRWAVLALDEKLYNKLGPKRAISPGDQFSVGGPQSFCKGSFNKLSCNKMRMVMNVAGQCNMDVVFTDVDNIFYHNPFEDDFGYLIQSEKYEYIYQTDTAAPPEPLEHECLKGIDNQGNTGFYYVKRNSTTIRKVIDSTLQRCMAPDNTMDDQALFWDEFRKVRRQAQADNKPMHHCSIPEYVDPFQESGQSADLAPFNYCCLDPYNYPIGKPFPPQNKDPITFHANWVVGKQAKIDRLRNSRADGYGWDSERIAKKKWHLKHLLGI